MSKNVVIEGYPKILKIVKRLTRGKLNYWSFWQVLVYIYMQGIYHALELLETDCERGEDE